MKCREARRSLVAYLDNDLDPSRVEALERHLAECRACASELERLRATFSLLAQESPPEAPEAFFANLLPRVRIRLEERQRAGTQLLPRFAYGSAAILAVLAVFLLVRPSIRPEREPVPLLEDQAGVGSLLEEVVSSIDLEVLELSFSEYEPSPALLSLTEASEGVRELLTRGLPSVDLERMEESFEEERDVSVSALIEDLNQSEMEELAANIKARWGE